MQSTASLNRDRLSFNNYLNMRKIMKCCRLLIQTGKKLFAKDNYEGSETLGFANK